MIPTMDFRPNVDENVDVRENESGGDVDECGCDESADLEQAMTMRRRMSLLKGSLELACNEGRIKAHRELKILS